MKYQKPIFRKIGSGFSSAKGNCQNGTDARTGTGDCKTPGLVASGPPGCGAGGSNFGCAGGTSAAGECLFGDSPYQ